jgi:hypothetical protein
MTEEKGPPDKAPGRAPDICPVHANRPLPTRSSRPLESPDKCPVLPRVLSGAWQEAGVDLQRLLCHLGL